MTQPSPSQDPQARPFQVDLRGVVELLSRHIYSSPHVFLRELLQNGRDALTARAELGQTASDGIRITPVSAASDEFVFVDDGIGLTVAEVGDLLATVGKSSKRDMLNLPRTDYLGQFGIGMLSCFMVAEDIVVRSRSAKGGPAVEWIGSTDGTFTVRELSAAETDARPIGTEVRLRPRPDEAYLATTESVLELAARYGEYLPVSVRVDLPGGGIENINREPVFAQPIGSPPSAELLEAGRKLIGSDPFDVIELRVPGTTTRGTAFVLPYAPVPGARQASRVYLGRMLLAERMDELLPDWAFFVRCIVDTSDLQPTASREQFVGNDQLEFTREQLGNVIRRWVIQLATTQPHRLAEFVAIHHVALKSLVLRDEELASFLTTWLSVETSIGVMTIGDLVRAYPRVRYAETVDEFRQISSIARGDEPVVNGGYTFDADIVRLLPDLFTGVSVERLTVVGELDNLDSPPLAELEAARTLEDRATAVLRDLRCEAAVRSFAPDDLTAIYVADPEILRSLERERARNIAPGTWGSVLGRIDKAEADERALAGITDAPAAVRLCLNWRNPLVQTIARLGDEAVFARTVQLLYVQAMLASHRPLAAADRAVLTTAMTDLVQLSVGFDEGILP